MGIRINGSTSGYTELSAGATPANNTLTLPSSNGSDGQFLQVDANGQLSFQTVVLLIAQTDPVIDGRIVGTDSTVTNPSILGGTKPYTFAYQWQFKESGGSSFANISGETSTTYSITATINGNSAENGTLRCAVTVTDADNSQLVINSNELTTIEFRPNMHSPAGIAMQWNVNTGSGGVASSVGWHPLPNNEKAVAITGNNNANTNWKIISDAGTVYQMNRQSTGSTTPSLLTGAQETWSGKLIAGLQASSSTATTQISTTGEARATTNSGSSWPDEWLTTTSGFSKVLWHNSSEMILPPIVVTEDGYVRYSSASGTRSYYILDGGTNTQTTSYNFMDVYITPPTGKKICYVAAAHLATPAGLVLLCNDQRLYTVGNPNIAGFPTNGTRSAPALVTSVTQKFEQIAAFSNVAPNYDYGLQAITADGQYWQVLANNSDTFEAHFSGTVFKSLQGQHFPYIDNCCTYNPLDMFAVGENNTLISTTNGPQATTIHNTWTLPSGFPTWNSSLMTHGGQYIVMSDYSGDWTGFVLPQ